MTTDLQAPAYAQNAAQLRLVGSRVRPFVSSITRKRQAAYHAAAGIPPAYYGDRVDASLLAIDAMLSISYTNEIAQGGLHAGHRVIQSGPVCYDETLTLEGTVTATRPMRQGTLITIDINVRRSNGEVPVQL